MKTRNTALPPSRVVVDTRGTKTTVALWDGGYIETINQDGLVEYEYDIYHFETRLRPNLAEIIDSDFDVWYEAAKEAEITTVKPPTLEELASQLLDAQIAIMAMSLE